MKFWLSFSSFSWLKPKTQITPTLSNGQKRKSKGVQIAYQVPKNENKKQSFLLRTVRLRSRSIVLPSEEALCSVGGIRTEKQECFTSCSAAAAAEQGGVLLRSRNREFVRVVYYIRLENDCWKNFSRGFESHNSQINIKQI